MNELHAELRKEHMFYKRTRLSCLLLRRAAASYFGHRDYREGEKKVSRDFSSGARTKPFAIALFPFFASGWRDA